MAHKKGLTASPEWWRHLRPFNKRRVAKAERQAAKRVVVTEEDYEDAKGLGLHNKPEKMKWMREKNGTTMIPHGCYCYDQNGICPYWDKADNKSEYEDGYCWFLMKGDWDRDGGGIGILWDQCKICDVNEEEVPEGTIQVVAEEDMV